MTKNKKIQSESSKELNYSIKDLSMDKIIPNVIDNFIVTIFEDHHTIVMPSHITGVQFKAWSHGRGGIFSKDVLRYALNKISALILASEMLGKNRTRTWSVMNPEHKLEITFY